MHKGHVCGAYSTPPPPPPPPACMLKKALDFVCAFIALADDFNRNV